MSEKKISIIEVTNPCAGCNVPGLDCGLCGLRIIFNKLPTREQTIYKMAKALCNMYYSACSECAFKDNPKECKAFLKDSDYYEQAETGLNAVLEINNNE